MPEWSRKSIPARPHVANNILFEGNFIKKRSPCFVFPNFDGIFDGVFAAREKTNRFLLIGRVMQSLHQ
jgi:hypothetical protein